MKDQSKPCLRCNGTKIVSVYISKSEIGPRPCGLCDGTGYAICNACRGPRPNTVRVSIRGRIEKFFGRICWACLDLDSCQLISNEELSTAT